MIESLASLPERQRSTVLRGLTDEQCAAILYDWAVWARPKQLPPECDWTVWLVLAGRGFGKTRTGAEWVRDQVENHGRRRVALIAPTAADVRDIMVEGESGIMAIVPPWNLPNYEPSKRRLTWPNGAIATTFSADEPDRLRGPQHDALWADELAAWKYPEAWDMAMFGLRAGAKPQAVVTTTPKPRKVLRELIELPSTVVTRGSTYENRANLAQSFFDQIVRKYEGTRLGRQELDAELLDEADGALWQRAVIDQGRVAEDAALPDMRRIVIAMDPAVSSKDHSDEMGIVVTGLGINGHGYVLQDLSGRMTPDKAARVAVNAYRLWEADRIIGEVNNGGDWIESVIRAHADDGRVAYKAIRASRGKATRAEPVAAIYEQKRVHHVGIHGELEDQMCTWEPDAGMPSPDRLDALVWGLTELMIAKGEARTVKVVGF